MSPRAAARRAPLRQPPVCNYHSTSSIRVCPFRSPFRLARVRERGARAAPCLSRFFLFCLTRRVQIQKASPSSPSPSSRRQPNRHHQRASGGLFLVCTQQTTHDNTHVQKDAFDQLKQYRIYYIVYFIYSLVYIQNHCTVHASFRLHCTLRKIVPKQHTYTDFLGTRDDNVEGTTTGCIHPAPKEARSSEFECVKYTFS